MNKEKIEKQLSDIDIEILSDLKKNLAEEMSKPTDERDEELISELKQTISETEEEIVNASRERSLDAVMKMLDEYEGPKHIKLYKRLSILAACLLVFLGLNAASLKVFGQNVFSAAYQLTTGGITISTEKPKHSNGVVISESDPFGMKAICAEYGFFPVTPSYIPEGFVLENINVKNDNYSDSIIFLYRKNDILLNFFFINYKSNTSIPPMGIPSDSYNVTEEQINGRTTYILKEDSQFTSSFIDKKIYYTIFAENLDHDEYRKILESLS